MPIISQETWDKMSQEEKQGIIDAYIRFKDIEETACKKQTNYGTLYLGDTSNGGTVMELLFGKHNLQSKPMIRTWDDVEKEHPEYFKSHNTPNPKFIPSQELRDKLFNKTMAR